MYKTIVKIINDLKLEDQDKDGATYKGFTLDNDEVFDYLFNLDGAKWLYRYADYHYGFSIGSSVINIIEGDIVISMNGLDEEVKYIVSNDGYAPFTPFGEDLADKYLKQTKRQN